MKKRNYCKIAVDQLDHLICICERCTTEGKHLNPEGLAVILRRIRRDIKSVGKSFAAAAVGD